MFTLATAALLVGATATSANAVVQQVGNYAVQITNGVSLSYCHAYTENKTNDTNSDIKGKFDAANGSTCTAWLERKRYNPDGSVQQDWTRVSDVYSVQSWTAAETGWHWNGTNAGSRVCIIRVDTGERGCSKGVW
ncbi:hypothetical protein AB5J56_02880 [Streptomyces sp. R21]|uniref:Uncharacterized protein n=1 Tax=Streptomyces sp. R21 TaxID=3238627 RepID=A0AB39NZN8_9ACTN